ncbi:hypothetical protein BCR34DRAFT_600657 [Clohesyomyces aquaticus]|uniref:RRM domain-containing protein n=1 Tax=Clohesyomyces aquaticus TaxID=1231657 RepID=A0A1Y1ZQB8_9PLEO|nr:hypothetical protein BCR34DRAFT_600657 [Clohesyomyces aquaticus]
MHSEFIWHSSSRRTGVVFGSEFAGESNLCDQVVEVYMTPWNIYGKAWEEFDSAEAARECVKTFDKYYRHHMGSVHAVGRHISATLAPSPSSDTEMLLLSDFRLEHEAIVRSRTPEITNLNDDHTRWSQNDLLNQVEEWNANPDEPEDEFYVEGVEIMGAGTALVQFAARHSADIAVESFNGEYWKTATIYVKYIPDEVKDDILAARKKEK